MEDFFNWIKETLCLLVIVLIAVGIVTGIVNGYYLFSRHFDISTGVVNCDGSQVYMGRLYRIDKTLETRNLQAPMFSVKVRGNRNFFRTEASYFCKELNIAGK